MIFYTLFSGVAFLTSEAVLDQPDRNPLPASAFISIFRERLISAQRRAGSRQFAARGRPLRPLVLHARLELVTRTQPIPPAKHAATIPDEVDRVPVIAFLLDAESRARLVIASECSPAQDRCSSRNRPSLSERAIVGRVDAIGLHPTPSRDPGFTRFLTPLLPPVRVVRRRRRRCAFQQ
jgi:hypothetical protein